MAMTPFAQPATASASASDADADTGGTSGGDELWERRLREGWIDENGDALSGGAWPRGTSEGGSDLEEGGEGEGEEVADGAERPAR